MQKLEEMTLRERVVATQRLNRELIEHLDQAFIPKVHNLRRVTRKNSPSHDHQEIADRSVHTAAAEVLTGDHFTVGVYQELMDYCKSVRRSVNELIDL